MSNCFEKTDFDLEYLYSHAEKIGKRVTEMDEENFLERVLALSRVDSISEAEARRVAFSEIMG